MSTTTDRSVHPVASEGFTIGDFYHASRPSYPPAALDLIRSELTKDKAGLKLSIVEHGAGSGLFTSLLLSPPPAYPSIPLASLIALDPSSSMRSALLSALAPELAQARRAGVEVRCEPGTFDQVPPAVEEGTVDAVVIAQAFHWSDPHYDAAMSAIGRMLKPDGVAVFLWNMEDDQRATWVKQLRAAYQAHEASSPQYRLRLWTQAFETPSYKRAFSPPSFTLLPSILPTTKALALDRALSKSYVARLPAEAQAELRAELVAVLDQGEGMVPFQGQGQGQGVFEYPYETEVVVMRRKPTTVA